MGIGKAPRVSLDQNFRPRESSVTTGISAARAVREILRREPDGEYRPPNLQNLWSGWSRWRRDLGQRNSSNEWQHACAYWACLANHGTCYGSGIHDEEFYGLAAREIVEGCFNKDLTAKAYALALGDQEKTHALYIQLRVPQLKAVVVALAAVNQLKEEIKRKDEAAEKKKRVAEEERLKKEAEAERRRREEREAQQAGDSWNREEVATTDGGPLLPHAPLQHLGRSPSRNYLQGRRFHPAS